MNNKQMKITLVLLLGLLVIFATAAVLVVKKSGGGPKQQLSKTPVAQPPKTSEPLYVATFSIIGPKETIKTGQVFPLTLKFKIKNTPANKGIIGISAKLKIVSPEKFLLMPTNIEETLPLPWQYLKKEVNKEGGVNIEAVFLKPGLVGDLSKEYTLAILKFTNQTGEKINLSLETQKSKVIAKENNLEIPFKLEVY